VKSQVRLAANRGILSTGTRNAALIIYFVEKLCHRFLTCLSCFKQANLDYVVADTCTPHTLPAVGRDVTLRSVGRSCFVSLHRTAARIGKSVQGRSMVPLSASERPSSRNTSVAIRSAIPIDSFELLEAALPLFGLSQPKSRWFDRSWQGSLVLVARDDLSDRVFKIHP
jgi:hypothetical protein